MLAMEPPGSNSPDGIRDEKVKVLRAIQPARSRDHRAWTVSRLSRGEGRRHDSQVETFAAVRLEIDSWRWADVPFLIRAGKCLAKTATEVLVRFHSPPQRFIASQTLDHSHNYIRIRFNPEEIIAIGRRGAEGRGEGRFAAGRADGQPAIGGRGAALRPAAAIGDGRRSQPFRPRRMSSKPSGGSSSRCSATPRRSPSTSREAGDRPRPIGSCPTATSGTTLEAGSRSGDQRARRHDPSGPTYSRRHRRRRLRRPGRGPRPYAGRRCGSRSSTAPTITCSSRCSTRWRPPRSARPTSPRRSAGSSGIRRTSP